MDELLEQSAAMHHHLCPRQVLGVRMGMLAGELLDLDLPQTDKRLFVFMETDGCTADGVAVARERCVGRRTMRMVDFGKVAATFVDTFSGAAVRIHPHPASRCEPSRRARCPRPLACPVARLPEPSGGRHRRRVPVYLTVDLAPMVSRNGLRGACAACGEEISNGREVMREGLELCRGGAGEAYYMPAPAHPIGRVLTLGQNAVIAQAVTPA